MTEDLLELVGLHDDTPMSEHEHIEDFVELIEEDEFGIQSAFTVACVNFKDVRKTLKKRGIYRRRSLSSIRNIVVHHSGTVTGSAEAYANYHVGTLGWPGIGYTIVIEQDGTVKLCNDLESITYHSGNANSYSVGVSLTGDFSRNRPTGAQWSSLYQVIEDLMAHLPSVKSVTSVIGHQECPGYASKICPSLDMDSMRGEIQSKNYREVKNKFKNDQLIKVIGGGIVAATPSKPSTGAKKIGTVTILADSLNERQSDNVTSKAVGSYTKNKKIDVFAEGKWGYQTSKGWIAKGSKYVSFAKASTHIGTVTSIVDSLNVRKTDDVSSPIVGTIKKGNAYKAYGTGKWGYDVGLGWVAKGDKYTKFKKL